MIIALANRLRRETEPRILAKFLYTFAWKGAWSVVRFRRRRRRAEFFPAFLALSVTNSCNLKCQGCWVTPSQPPRQLTLAELDAIVATANRHGSFFFAVLGGEPLLHPDLLELFGRHPDSYFQLFTNGTLLDATYARRLRALGNVTPLISIEGTEGISDERRGGSDVYARSLVALRHCRENRLVTGVATSLCRSNIAELATAEFLRELIRLGVHYAWYYIYRPVGSNPTPELALTQEQILALRRFIVDIRSRLPILIIDAYWDAEGRALCPAALGLSYHVNPAGDIEPCPVIQFARDRVTAETDLAETLTRSTFLRDFRSFAAQTTPGCVLLENPAALQAFVTRQTARDTTGRGTGFAELAAMTAQPGHHCPGQELPEKHWFYRLAKKFSFFGFGAYG